MDQDLSLWGLAFEVATKNAGNPGVHAVWEARRRRSAKVETKPSLPLLPSV